MATQKDMIEALRRRRSTSPVPTGSVGEVTKVSRTGPTVEYINPTFEGVKSEAKELPKVLNALGVLDTLYQLSDKYIPAEQDDTRAFYTGLKRQFGASPVGRAVGMGDVGAQSYEAIKKPYTPIFRSAVGDAGAFTETDRAALMNMFPSGGESADVRRNKRSAASQILNQRIQTYNEMYRALKNRRTKRNG